MVRRAVALLLLTAGCDRVFGLDPRPPVDAAIDMAMVDMEPPLTCMRPLPVGTPAEDPDGDGLINADDDCPNTFDEGWNEDADCVPDACDPCPHLPDPSHDVDADGIGDACDLDLEHEDQAGFESLHDTGNFVLLPGPTWSVDVPTSVLQRATSAQRAVALRTEPSKQNFLAETRFDLAATPPYELGLFFGFPTINGLQDGYFSALVRMQDDYAIVLYEYRQGTLATVQPEPLLSPVSGHVRWTVKVTQTQVEVTLTPLDGSPPTTVAHTLDAPLPATSYVGVGGIGERNEFHYLFHTQP